ncbi:uncharacterized protein LOC131950170 [Physella acuta]|uniref:uncharacterized protein LOC131950170 n=1 Tax=Physella acuta TaxID=109671 RepID=UPI0027DC0D89|nr:uncharacterized protein LOC131950170 [Physella acuta]
MANKAAATSTPKKQEKITPGITPLAERHKQLVTSPATTTGASRPAIEKEILGPLRVWHIIGIVVTVLLIAVVIGCCCYHDFRVPRTRQEIKANHEKRMMNKKYLFVLERRPDDLLKPDPEKQATRAREQPRPNPLTNHRTAPKPQVLPKPALDRPRDTSGGGNHVKAKRGWGTADDYTGVPRTPKKVGVETPLAMHPKDLLSMMAKVKKTNGARE